MSSVNELWGWPQSPGSVILGPCGCADKEVLKKKGREGPGTRGWPAGPLQALSRSCQLLIFVV